MKEQKQEIETRKTVKKSKGIRIKLTCVIAVISIAVGFFAGWQVHTKFGDVMNKTEITNDYITGKLENVGELTTQKVTYSSRQLMEKGTIPFITKKGFVMQYNATMTAGIDMSEMKVKTSDEKVTIYLPHATAGKAHVDPDSITFTDEKKAILNWNTQEDVAEALAAAEKDAEENPAVDKEQLIEKADENAQTIIHNLLDDSVGRREVEIKYL